jgi:predicted nuclease of predicted toxin-antitoxin system
VSLRIKVDEDLSSEVAHVFRRADHDAVTVDEQGWSGCHDSVLWSAVQKEGRVLVTADKGFADVRRHSPGTHGGVILLRLDGESRSGYISLVGALIGIQAIEELAGAVAVVTPRGVRIHRARSGDEE